MGIKEKNCETSKNAKNRIKNRKIFKNCKKQNLLLPSQNIVSGFSSQMTINSKKKKKPEKCRMKFCEKLSYELKINHSQKRIKFTTLSWNRNT